MKQTTALRFEDFFTPKEKKLLSKLPSLTEEERLIFETLADYLIDAAIESLSNKNNILKKDIKKNNLKVQNG